MNGGGTRKNHFARTNRYRGFQEIPKNGRAQSQSNVLPKTHAPENKISKQYASIIKYQIKILPAVKTRTPMFSRHGIFIVGYTIVRAQYDNTTSVSTVFLVPR